MARALRRLGRPREKLRLWSLAWGDKHREWEGVRDGLRAVFSERTQLFSERPARLDRR